MLNLSELSCLKGFRLGVQFATKARRDRAQPADKWYPDEVVIASFLTVRNIGSGGLLMQGRRFGHSGLVTSEQCGRFALFSNLFEARVQPRMIITEKLHFYGAAKAVWNPGIAHRKHKGLNNRAASSHRYTRRREKIMGHFNSPSQALRFLSVHDQTTVLFRPNIHHLSAHSYRNARIDAFALCTEYSRKLNS